MSVQTGKIRVRIRTRSEGVLLDPCDTHASVYVKWYTVSVEQDFVDRQSFFLDLRIQVWFSGMLVSAETENLCTVAQARASSASHVLLRSCRWSLFNPQVLTLTGWDRVDGLGTDLRSLVRPQ